MGRTACINLPQFPLQLLLLRRPDWRPHPVAVVDCDKPQGTILWVNEQARSRRVLPGMRYAAALSLAAGLRAATVPRQEIDGAVNKLVERLRRFSPHVEPDAGQPGLFWLNASGLERLHGSLRNWAGLVRRGLEQAGFRATVVVGFTRFGSSALARGKRGLLVMRDAADERAAARQVALDRLSLEPPVRDALAKLGITTLGRFVDLPGEGIEKRFGPRVRRLHRSAADELRLPLQPRRADPPAMRRLALDHPESDAQRLMALIERLLHPLIEGVAAKGRALAGVRVGFRFERLGDHVETIRPATRTLDAAQLLQLIRLRLQAVRKLPDGVVEVILAAEETEAEPRQLRLFSRQSRRDPAAANRALARVRAQLGEAAVVRARLREGHLPEARFDWERLDGLGEPRPRNAVEGKRLVRRIQVRPLPLPPRPHHEPDGWMLHGLKQGPVTRVQGPYVVSGGWWNRPIHREYHFAETGRGELLWVYYDRDRRRWFLQGRVE
jgi:protein ImuB